MRRIRSTPLVRKRSTEQIIAAAAAFLYAELQLRSLVLERKIVSNLCEAIRIAIDACNCR